MTPFISVIIPAYNAARFIGEALNSLLSQSFWNIEIILLNDGSKDNTGKICTDYATRYSCIIYIDKKNEGVAKTRNRALDIAKGKYVMFVDADDVIYPGSLQTITDTLRKTGVDLLRYEFKTINETGDDLHPNYEAKRRLKYTDKILSVSDFMNKVMRAEYQLCFNVFKRSLLNRHCIRFLENCTYNEDTLFLVRYFTVSQTHVYTPHVVYGYRKSSEAVTNKFTDRNFRDVTNVFTDIMQSLPEEQKLHDAVKAIAERLGRSLYEHNKIFKDENVQSRVKEHCCTHPVTIDWRLYNFLGEISWKILDIFRKINRRII